MNLEPKYQIFTDSDETYSSIKPSIKNVLTYVRRFVKWSPISMTKRSQVALMFGISEEVTDEVSYVDYQVERAKLLFPFHVDEIEERKEELNTAEVERAQGNFSDAAQLQLQEPDSQFAELQGFLQDLTSSMEKIDQSLTVTRATE